MATTKRISVVRVPRQIINQANPTETQDDPLKDSSTTQLKPHHLPRISKVEQKTIPRTKTDVFTLSPPRPSEAKSEDLNQQTARSEPSRYSTVIQQQPAQTTTWVKNSSSNSIRPELNWVPTNKWSHGVCALSEDWNMCCYACACWCCFRHEISTMMGEHWCLWFVNVTPLTHLRTKFRQQYSIEGSIAEDCCYATFCPICVALQLANEGRHYGHRIFS